jgi:hypothetical protein
MTGPLALDQGGPGQEQASRPVLRLLRVGGSIDSDQLGMILTLRAHFVRPDSLRESVRPRPRSFSGVNRSHGLHLVPDA